MVLFNIYAGIMPCYGITGFVGGGWGSFLLLSFAHPYIHLCLIMDNANLSTSTGNHLSCISHNQCTHVLWNQNNFAKVSAPWEQTVIIRALKISTVHFVRSIFSYQNQLYKENVLTELHRFDIFFFIWDAHLDTVARDVFLKSITLY